MSKIFILLDSEYEEAANFYAFSTLVKAREFCIKKEPNKGARYRLRIWEFDVDSGIAGSKTHPIDKTYADVVWGGFSGACVSGC